MRIEIELPEWADEGQTLYIFAGTELVACKPTAQPFSVKTGRCSRCGRCCGDWDENWPLGADEAGVCLHLERDPGLKEAYSCGLRMTKPFICCATPIDKKPNENCTIEFKTAD